MRRWCEVVAAKTTVNKTRSCRGIAWSIPHALRPTPKSAPTPANEGIMLLAFPNPATPGSQSEFYSRVDIDPLPFATRDFEMNRYRSTLQLNNRSPDVDGYAIYSGGLPGDYRALLIPVNSDEYFLLCSRKDKQAGVALVGACEVSLRYDEIIKLTYYVPAQSVGQASKFNKEILARVDALRARGH
jgi:hypothetical protein